jgi:hypothetical protein
MTRQSNDVVFERPTVDASHEMFRNERWDRASSFAITRRRKMLPHLFARNGAQNGSATEHRFVRPTRR